jgi:hypothetical protein
VGQICDGVRDVGEARKSPKPSGAPRTALAPRYANVATVWRSMSRADSLIATSRRSVGMAEGPTVSQDLREVMLEMNDVIAHQVVEGRRHVGRNRAYGDEVVTVAQSRR